MENTENSTILYTPVYDKEITKSLENNFSRITGKGYVNYGKLFCFLVFVDMINYTEYIQRRSIYTDSKIKVFFTIIYFSEECYLDHAGATLYSDTQIKNIASDLHNSLYANPHSIGTASNVTQDIIENMRHL